MKNYQEDPQVRSKTPLMLILGIVLGVLVLAWLINTPLGLLGKADALGYAVCHRIELRSFHLGERALPLCARCSGMYLGALLGLLVQSWFGRKRAEFPPKAVLWLMGLFLLAFGIDGINSTVQLLREGRGLLYTTTNLSRLITGTGVGIGMSLLLLPAFHQTVWLDYKDSRVIQNTREFFTLLGLAVLLDLMLLSNSPLLLYPLALLSGAGVLLILTMVYTMATLMLLKKENLFKNWRELWPYLALGFIFALSQIALIDYGRYALTHTWTGFGF